MRLHLIALPTVILLSIPAARGAEVETKSNRPLGVIITSSGERLEIEGDRKPPTNYWTEATIERFWTDQETRRQGELKASERRQAELAKLQREREAAELERAKRMPPALLPEPKGPALQKLLRTALHQATLDRGMEDPDGNQYLFEFPAGTQLPDMQGHARMGMQISPDKKPETVYLYQANEVAAQPTLRNSWYEAKWRLGLKRGNARVYVFTFAPEQLVQLGLLAAAAGK